MESATCTYCQNVILVCRISCALCTDYDLCLQCFALGAESAQHKKDHDYRVYDNGSFTVFDTSDWTAAEEELLLGALEHYGFGNWADVANHVKTKSQEECKEHYSIYFMDGNVGKVTFPKEPGKVKVIDHSCPDGGPLSPSLTKPLPPVELSLQEQHELGYMPLRDDFEREYDNESESLVSSLSINYDDEDIEIAMKLAVGDMYRQRLKERDRRKRIAREHGLLQAATSVGIKKSLSTKKKQSKEERDLQEKLKVFAQFHTTSEHDRLLENYQKERRLKSRVKELMRFRRNGIIKIEEATRYETEKLRREKRKEKKKLSNSATAKRSLMGKREAEERREDENQDDITSDTKEGIVGGLGAEVLTEREKRLCNVMGMKYATYITIKTSMIKDNLQRKQGHSSKFRYPSNLDKSHRRRILKFLTDNGWIGGAG